MPVWVSGVVILLLVIITSFLGYVLPWGQISFWGATVITNLLSVIPFKGELIVQWIWGGFRVGGATLTRFFSLHFICPLVLTLVVLIHLVGLHRTASNNPVGVRSNFDKIPFHPYFRVKDIVGWIVILTVLGWLVLWGPWALGDRENFLEANPIVTPTHIKPEWYTPYTRLFTKMGSNS